MVELHIKGSKKISSCVKHTFENVNSQISKSAHTISIGSSLSCAVGNSSLIPAHLTETTAEATEETLLAMKFLLVDSEIGVNCIFKDALSFLSAFFCLFFLCSIPSDSFFDFYLLSLFP